MQNLTTSNNSLPFELTSDALAGWLESLRIQPQTQAAQHLNQALKQIKEEKCEPEQLLPLLINLAPLTLYFSNSLSLVATTESGLSEKALKLGKFSMHLPRQLALIFCQIIESKKLSTDAQQTAIYYALQLIGFCLRCYCLFYEAQSATLWKKFAWLYKQAAKKQFLTLQQATKLSEFKGLNTIELVVKRNLLFSLLTPTLFKNTEISRLFQFAQQHANLLQISTDNEILDFGFYWDLDSDAPPCVIRKANRSLPKGYMAIDSRQLGYELQTDALNNDLSPSAQAKLSLILNSYQQMFDSIIPGMPASSKMISGFFSVCSYLHELNKLLKISQLSAQSSRGEQPKQDFSLVPLEYQRHAFETGNSPFTQQKNLGQAVSLIKTPNKSYLVAESKGLDCQTGDLVLLYKEQHPASLAIIRQQHFSELSKSRQYLLELITGICSIYSLADHAIDSFVIIVGEEGKDPQAFLTAGKYSTDSSLGLSQGKFLHLTSCLESNDFFARFRFQSQTNLG